ncbi:MAG TPA: response regulator transcription factor [Gemmatimonadaceae bacterium]|nr:response regulator transcription factor [Gemmatimonadaceae bacterium]
MKLLVIDDDRMVAELIRRGLREEGYAIDVANDGTAGSMLAFVNAYDGIILDVMLPDRTGLEIVQELRLEGQKTPVLLLTGKSAKEDVIRGLDLGADDYLVKPFDIDVLKARVRALVRRGGAHRTERIAFGGIVVDRLLHTATVQGRKLQLTPKEHSLLEYLLLHAEQVVSRTELLEKVWDLHFDPGSNVIDVHVARLRNKLRWKGAAPELATVRGVGYRLTLEADAD